jgi:outer membrane protein assembly factor BamB
MRFVLPTVILLAVSGCEVRSPPPGGTSGGGSSTGATGGSSTGGAGTSGLDICVHPQVVNFGPTQVLGTPATQALSVGNCGFSPVSITFPGLQGPQASDFSVTGESNATLQPGESESLTITFSPAAVGASAATLPYGTCAGCPNETINVTGTGVDGALTFSPSPVSFGQVLVGSTTSQEVTGTNTGTELLTVTSLRTENNNGIFVISQAPSFPLTLDPSQAFDLIVSYTPSASDGGNQDQLLGVFTVADPAVEPRTVQDQLAGSPAPGPCSLSIVPTAVNFGNVAVGVTALKEVTLSDMGNVPCQVSQIAFSASTDPYFGLGAGQATLMTLQPGAPQTISVSFSPTSQNGPPVRLGRLTFQTGDATNPNATVPLSATIQNPSVYADGWPKWHLDDFNSGQSSANTLWLQGVVAWKFKIGVPGSGRTYINSPVISTVTGLNPAPGYLIYQVNTQGVLYGLANNGALAFMTALSGLSDNPQPSTPAVLADGSIVVALGSAGNPSNLYYLSNTGIVTFSAAFGNGGFDSCPALSQDGTLLLADAYGASAACGGVAGSDPFSALAFTANAAGAWIQAAGLALPFSKVAGSFGVAVDANDNSYWGNDGTFFAVSSPAAGFAQVVPWPACGMTLTPAGVSAVSNLELDAAVTGNLYAYSAWEVGTAATGYSVMGNIAALSTMTGAEFWNFSVPAASLPAGWTPLQSDVGNASPAVAAANGTVYVGSGSGLYALAGATGAKQWLFPSANVSSSPAIGGDGTIFFGCDDGTFYAVTPAGALRFKIVTGGPISSSPAIAPDGTVVFVSDDGNVYDVQ